MFARLVTNITTFSANVYYNTLMDVITGAISNTSQLDSTLFSQGSSAINSTVAPGWSTYISSANAAGSSYILSGCAPRVIRAPWSDDGNQYKYLWTGVTHSTNTYNQIYVYPAESWNTSTKVGGNVFSTPATTSQTTQLWNSFVQYDTNPGTTGTVTIVSASPNHLFVGYNKIGTAYFNNYFFLSEYTRDDPWNTVGNGYPSWFSMGQFYGGSYQASGNTGYSSGTITRGLNSTTGVDSNHAIMSDASTTYITTLTRYYNIAATNWSTYKPFGLIGGTHSAAGYDLVNNYNIRDANRNAAIPLNEFRLAMGTYLNQTYGLGLFAGGSITTKAPYIYGTKNSNFSNLDEIVINGNLYQALKLINSDSTILIKET